MSHARKKGMSDFEFFQTQYLGGKISAKHSEYKDYAMKETNMVFARWFILNSDRLASLSPQDAVSEILEIRSKLEYLKGTTEITQMSLKLGDTVKRTDARSVRELIKRAREGVSSPTDSKTS
jgi:hypothetical protein